ncbi:MAG: GNAT family N-acetyltransferase [Candidatus Obscuribacterales bacterium]|nr:GNAT family N-acetyltransferase [Candidatus Obscuribacterales bacterium]
MNLTHRLAGKNDIAELHKLIELSVRFLQKDDYTAAQIDGALGTVLGLDTQLIEDGTYFVVEDENQIVGCGGWSYRRTLFGSDHASVRESELLDPLVDAAKIRAFFIHPDWARKGIGSQILGLCENAARQSSFKRFEMGATLTGVPLYQARGYSEFARVEVPLSNGEFLQVVKMQKNAESA